MTPTPRTQSNSTLEADKLYILTQVLKHLDDDDKPMKQVLFGNDVASIDTLFDYDYKDYDVLTWKENGTIIIWGLLLTLMTGKAPLLQKILPPFASVLSMFLMLRQSLLKDLLLLALVLPLLVRLRLQPSRKVYVEILLLSLSSSVMKTFAVGTIILSCRLLLKVSRIYSMILLFLCLLILMLLSFLGSNRST